MHTDREPFGPVRCHARWREELVASSSRGTLVFELTMGVLHGYFPTATRWAAAAPPWAAEDWEAFRDACERWCAANRAGFTLTDDAMFYEEKPREGAP